MKNSTPKENIETKIYNNDGILRYCNKRIDEIKAYIDGGKMKNGRLFRLFELRDLNKLLDDLKKGKERIIKFKIELQNQLKKEKIK
jgi:hypothetical protein